LINILIYTDFFVTGTLWTTTAKQAHLTSPPVLLSLAIQDHVLRPTMVPIPTTIARPEKQGARSCLFYKAKKLL